MRRAPILLALLLAACDDAEEERASEPAPVECGSPSQVLLAFATRGAGECAESISIACDGSARVSAERPCARVLQDRPGEHQIRLERRRIPELRALAGQLRAPVTGAAPRNDRSITAPVARPLRDGDPDRQASALYDEILAQIEASVPLANLELTVRPAGTPLTQGASGLIVLRLRGVEERTVHLGSSLAFTIRRTEGDEVWLESPPTVLVLANLDGTPWDGASVAQGQELIAGVRVTPPSAGSVQLVAELRTSASFDADAEVPERSFLSAPETFEVAPAP